MNDTKETLTGCRERVGGEGGVSGWMGGVGNDIRVEFNSLSLSLFSLHFTQSPIHPLFHPHPYSPNLFKSQISFANYLSLRKTLKEEAKFLSVKFALKR